MVLVLLEPDEKGTIQENIQYYTLADGETPVDTAPPTCKPYAGADGLIKPHWNNTAWVEGATANEIAAWNAAHPAPELSPPPPFDSALIADRIYSGVDLSAKFAGEIAAAGGDVWAWIRARIRAANYAGIHVGDYIPFVAGGYVIKAEVAGMDTYCMYSDLAAIGHHIDFISRDCWPEVHVYNKADYNNGTSVSPHPWLASDLYAWLNSLTMQVPNSATANPAMVTVDYRTSGVYSKLPAALQAVIVPKRDMLAMRYTAGALLNHDNMWGWAYAGKLWLPTEMEVYGCFVTSTRPWGGSGIQYPIFAENGKRIKKAWDTDNPTLRTTWWLPNPADGDPRRISLVNGTGYGDFYAASYKDFRAPVCFRIA